MSKKRNHVRKKNLVNLVNHVKKKEIMSKIKINIIIVLIMSVGNLSAQQFSGDGIAVHKDSAIIKSWATAAEIKRGYINIADTNFTYTESGITSNHAFAGNTENALGKADGSTISLGDGGEIILTFGSPIINSIGPDFVVFENALLTPPTQNILTFVELAFVEVSSDGEHFFRFPAISEQQYETQIKTFEAVDYRLYHNFAGIYPVLWGTPFDLDDIENNELLDKQNITHIKIIDCIGTINPEFASYDSQGNIVNDPYPTPFATCGFDLDAVGVIHQKTNVNVEQIYSETVVIFPSPAKDRIEIRFTNTLKDIESENKIEIYDISGRLTAQFRYFGEQINVSDLQSGLYIIKIYHNNMVYQEKLIKQ